MFHEEQNQRGPKRGRSLDRQRRGPGPHRFGPGDHHAGGRGRRGGRQRRGDVRAAVVVLLEEQDRNGYQLIQELTERSKEMWRPSPGSIYPVLQQLEDEGLVAVTSTESGRTYGLTDAGKVFVAEKREQLGKPWESADAESDGAGPELMSNFRQVAGAVRQVLSAGTDAQIVRGAVLLADVRRALYGILAEGNDE